jgi:hypothetical protein
MLLALRALVGVYGTTDARHFPEDNRSEAEGVSEETSGTTNYPDHGGPAGGGKPPEPGRPMDVQKSNIRSGYCTFSSQTWSF